MCTTVERTLGQHGHGLCFQCYAKWWRCGCRRTAPPDAGKLPSGWGAKVVSCHLVSPSSSSPYAYVLKSMALEAATPSFLPPNNSILSFSAQPCSHSSDELASYYKYSNRCRLLASCSGSRWWHVAVRVCPVGYPPAIAPRQPSSIMNAS